MELKFKLGVSDFLEFQLFSFSKSKRGMKNRFRSRLIVPIIYLVFGLLIFFTGKKTLGIGFLLFAIAWFFVYPIYTKIKYKKYFKNHILENQNNKIDRESYLSFSKDYIIADDSITLSKTKTSELVSLTELKHHFFLKIKTGQSFIIPKKCINDINAFKDLMNDYKVVLINEVEWEWK